MSKRGLSKGGCLLIVSGLIAAILVGIEWVRTGHLPADLSYGVLFLIGVSILADAEQYFRDIKENTEEIQEQMEKLTDKVDSLESTLESLRRELR
jgi:predicted nuclease with TOPRIM domain